MNKSVFKKFIKKRVCLTNFYDQYYCMCTIKIINVYNFKVKFHFKEKVYGLANIWKLTHAVDKRKKQKPICINSP